MAEGLSSCTPLKRMGVVDSSTPLQGLPGVATNKICNVCGQNVGRTDGQSVGRATTWELEGSRINPQLILGYCGVVPRARH